MSLLQHLNQQQFFIYLEKFDSTINVKIVRENIQKMFVEHFRNEIFQSLSS